MLAALLIVSLQSPDLHPVLAADPASLSTAYDRGQRVAHDRRSLEALARKWSRPLASARFAQPFVVFLPEIAVAELDGYSDQKAGKKARGAGAPLKDEDRRIRFQVQLYAWPQVSDDGTLTRVAKRDDVDEVKFRLSIDGYAFEPASPPFQSSSRPTIGYLKPADTGDDCVVWTPVKRNSHEFGTAAGIFSMVSPSLERSTEAKGYWGFGAKYEVEFPLFRVSGPPIVTRRTKTIELQVIYPSGVHRTTFDLSKLVPGR
jgi:hypothetical protein